MEIFLSALLAILGYLALEYIKTRNVVNALLSEAADAIDRINTHLAITDWDSTYARMLSDKTYSPYMTHYPPPLHLYRRAIDDMYFLSTEPTKAVLLAHKSEMISAAMIDGLRSEQFKDFPAERKVAYVKLMVMEFETLRDRLQEMTHKLNDWRRHGLRS